MRTAQIVAGGVRIRDGERDFTVGWHAIEFVVVKEKHVSTKAKTYKVALAAHGRVLTIVEDGGYPTRTLAQAACEIARNDALRRVETKIIAPQEHKSAASN